MFICDGLTEIPLLKEYLLMCSFRMFIFKVVICCLFVFVIVVLLLLVATL